MRSRYLDYSKVGLFQDQQQKTKFLEKSVKNAAQLSVVAVEISEESFNTVFSPRLAVFYLVIGGHGRVYARFC